MLSCTAAGHQGGDADVSAFPLININTLSLMYFKITHPSESPLKDACVFACVSCWRVEQQQQQQ